MCAAMAATGEVFRDFIEIHIAVINPHENCRRVFNPNIATTQAG
jgi:hypothetical protein